MRGASGGRGRHGEPRERAERGGSEVVRERQLHSLQRESVVHGQLRQHDCALRVTNVSYSPCTTSSADAPSKSNISC